MRTAYTQAHLVMRITMRIEQNDRENRDRFVNDRKRNEPQEIYIIQCTLIAFVRPKIAR